MLYLRDASTPPARRLVIFTRLPRAGEAKTRLIPALGAEGAAALQRAMTKFTLACAAPQDSGVRVEIRYAGGSAAELAAWLGPAYGYAPQGEGDLGERMLRAFRENFTQGFGQVIVIGTDCPAIDCVRIEEAFRALQQTDLVFGPASDGGYYLIGARSAAQERAFPLLFQDIAWSTETVLSTTLAQAEAAGFTHSLLAMEHDIDRPEDLRHWEAALARTRISVVIPALNEAADIAGTIASARAAENIEIIVVDGGSHDGTGKIATEAGARVIVSTPGRARQLNAGAAAVTGGYLLFLHADTVLPEGYDAELRRTLANPRVAFGAFRLAINAAGWGYRLIEWAANGRSRYWRKPYGDQALFLRRAVYERSGGFRALPIMEDYDLVCRLREQGRCVILDAAVRTSARRWARLGIWRTTVINYAAVIAWHLGVDPDRIAGWYRGQRGE